MNRSILNSALVSIGLLILLGGCKLRKETLKKQRSMNDGVVVEQSKNKQERLNAIREAQANFNTYVIKARAELTMEDSHNHVTMNIRMQKDEVIWVSVTALVGLEVARALITPDSIKVLNRLEGTYTVKPFSFIHQFTHEEINFQALQAVLIGNAVTEWMGDTSRMIIDGDRTKFNGGVHSLAFDYQFNAWNKLVQASLSGEKNNQSLTIDYADFMTLSGKNIPQSVNMQSQVNDRYIKLDLHYARVDLDEVLSFPFTVPKRFSVKN
ncbi:MAG: DUF4292 domain-containing protein [Pedobacter sp.]|nr:MAG: DUF4292 domain-containing protein [Pedobacter sp.]